MQSLKSRVVWLLLVAWICASGCDEIKEGSSQIKEKISDLKDDDSKSDEVVKAEVPQQAETKDGNSTGSAAPTAQNPNAASPTASAAPGVEPPFALEPGNLLPGTRRWYSGLQPVQGSTVYVKQIRLTLRKDTPWQYEIRSPRAGQQLKLKPGNDADNHVWVDQPYEILDARHMVVFSHPAIKDLGQRRTELFVDKNTKKKRRTGFSPTTTVAGDSDGSSALVDELVKSYIYLEEVTYYISARRKVTRTPAAGNKFAILEIRWESGGKDLLFSDYWLRNKANRRYKCLGVVKSEPGNPGTIYTLIWELPAAESLLTIWYDKEQRSPVVFAIPEGTVVAATDNDAGPSASPTPAATTDDDTPKVSEADERRAAGKLRAAKTMLDQGKIEPGKKWLQEILKDYPDSEAAKTAKELLEGI